MVIQMFLVLLTAVTMQGQLSVCNVSNEMRVFGALGKSMLLHLSMPANADEVRLRKDRKILIKVKPSEKRTTAGDRNRIEFISNGTVRISSSSSSDSGVYKWEVFDSWGTLLLNMTFSLQIQDPLPQPHLHVLCQSLGERRVQCIPSGQKYGWSLNGAEINSSVALMNEPGDVIVLKGHVTGSLTCTVNNNVSSNFTTAELPVCREGDYLKQVCFHGEDQPDLRVDPDSLLTNTVQNGQLCVNSRVFLLACGGLAMVVTLTAVLCCLRIAVGDKSKSLLCEEVVYTEVRCGNKEERKQWREMQESTTTDTEVWKGVSDDQQPEGQTDTCNQTFSTYGLE